MKDAQHESFDFRARSCGPEGDPAPRPSAACHGRRKFRFRHKRKSPDAAMIPLCPGVFDPAVSRRSKGVVKLHPVLDHGSRLPQLAVVTVGKTAGTEAARRQRFGPGTMLVFDRGRTDVARWLELSRHKVFFVTRLKDNIKYGAVRQRAVRPEAGIVRDELVLLARIQDVEGRRISALCLDSGSPAGHGFRRSARRRGRIPVFDHSGADARCWPGRCGTQTSDARESGAK